MRPRDTMDISSIQHHFGGGAYVKEVEIPAGFVLVQHKHRHDHLSYLAAGEVELTVDGVTQYLKAPVCVTILAERHHAIKSITDARWLCIHATDCTDPEAVDEVLVLPGRAEDMRDLAESLL